MKKIFYLESAEWGSLDFSGTEVVGKIFDGEECFKPYLAMARNGETMYLCSEDELREFKDPNYETLARILKMAYDQASAGKGKERHANGEKFEDQPIMTIAKGHGLGYQTGQAAKKLQEAHTLLKLRGKHAAIQEILGAINYAAAAVLLIEQMDEGGSK